MRRFVLLIIALFLTVSIVEGGVELTQKQGEEPCAACIRGAKAWVVISPTGTDQDDNVHKRACLTGTNTMEVDDEGNHINVGTIHLRFTVELTPTQCPLCGTFCSYKVKAKYKNKAGVYLATNYPDSGIERNVTDGEHRFDPGWNGNSAWTIIDPTLTYTSDLIKGCKGTIEIEVAAVGHSHSATYEAEVCFVGYDTRCVIVSHDNPFTTNNSECSVLWEEADWEPNRTVYLNVVVTGVNWDEDDPMSLSEFEYEQTQGGQHWRGVKELSGSGTAVEGQNPTATISGSVSDKWGTSGETHTTDLVLQ